MIYIILIGAFLWAAQMHNPSKEELNVPKSTVELKETHRHEPLPPVRTIGELPNPESKEGRKL